MESDQLEGSKKGNDGPNILRPPGQKGVCSDPMKPTFPRHRLKAIHVYRYYHRGRSKLCGLFHVSTSERSVSEEHSTARNFSSLQHATVNGAGIAAGSNGAGIAAGSKDLV